MSRFRVSRRADKDLLDIYLYGVRAFGRPRAISYQEKFYDCFSMLADNPRMGRLSNTLRPGMRRHEHGSHVILYKDNADHVLIVAIVHGRGIRGLKL